MASAGEPEHPVIAQLNRSLTAGQGARSGAKWLGMSRLATQAATFAFSILNARLLTPSEFGLAAIAVALISLAGIFTDIGLGAAVVQAKVATERILNTAFWLNVAAGLLVAALIAALASPAAAFYGEPELFPLLLCVAVAFAVTRGSVQTAILERTYQYKRLAVIETTAVVIGLILTPVLAIAGLGPAALVIGPLAQTVIKSLSLWLAVPWRPSGRPDRGEALSLWRYTRGLVGFNVMNYWAARNLDTLILGRAVSTADLGGYNRAYNLMMVPVQQTSVVLSRVLFPSLSRLADEPRRVAQAWVKGMAAAAMFTMPLALTMAATAPAAVLVLYGEPWRGMVPELELLALSAVPQTLTASCGAVYRALGRTGQLFRLGILTTGLTALAILIGVSGGTEGVAAGLLAVSFVNLLVMSLPLVRALDIGFADFAAIRAALLISAIVVAAELAVRFLVPVSAPFFMLSLQALAGGAAFGVGAWFADPPLLRPLFARVGIRPRGLTRSSDGDPVS